MAGSTCTNRNGVRKNRTTPNITRTDGSSVAITFTNDGAGLPTSNQPISARLASTLIQIVQADSAITSPNVNGTLGLGLRVGPNDHTLGYAVDINSINGQSVKSLVGSSLLNGLENTITGNPNVRYIAAPDVAAFESYGANGIGTGIWTRDTTLWPVGASTVNGHGDHVHIGVFSPNLGVFP